MQGGRDEEETEITLNVDFFSLIFSPVLYNSLFFLLSSITFMFSLQFY